MRLSGFVLLFTAILLCRITVQGSSEQRNTQIFSIEKGRIKDLKADDTFSVGYAKVAFAGLFGGGYPPLAFNFGGHGGHGNYLGAHFTPYGYNPYVGAGFGLHGSGFLGHHHHGHHYHHHGHSHFGLELVGFPSLGFHDGVNF